MKGLLPLLLLPVLAYPHGGGQNEYGCHNQSSLGTYHCHNSTFDLVDIEQMFDMDGITVVTGLPMFGYIMEVSNVDMRCYVYVSPQGEGQEAYSVGRCEELDIVTVVQLPEQPTPTCKVSFINALPDEYYTGVSCLEAGEELFERLEEIMEASPEILRLTPELVVETLE